MSTPISKGNFEQWLRQYGIAWELRDPEKDAELFTDNAEYYWTPFDDSKRGTNEIAVAWQEATSQQKDVHFSFTILSIVNSAGIARWHTTFTRIATGKQVEIDGILLSEFDSDLKCRVFREWWHRRE